jgi:putative ABC transport system permease protein
MRFLFEIFGQTLRTLWAHKLRSFLTMFGIAWGVGSLLLLVGLGEGFRSGNRKHFDEIGENVMFIWGGRAPTIGGSFNSLRWYFLTYKDYKAIQTDCPDVKAVTPVISRDDIRAVSEYYQSSGRLMGVLPDFSQIRYMPMGTGRWFNDLDDSQKRLVVVLGDESAKVLFQQHDATGSTILLNNVRFHVVGTMKRLGHGDNNGLNLRIFVPFHTMQEYFPPLGMGNDPDAVSFLNYQPISRALHETAKLEVHRVLARNHGNFDYHNPDAFDEWDTIRTVDQIGKIFDAMNLFLGSVGLVTLALGAIGIVNIMLVAVADRTREIGLRKALGATNRSILFQFFVEGALLTLISGGIGLGGAAGIMALLGLLPELPGFDYPRIIPSTATLAIAALAFAGIVAGLYPAHKASILQPVEALRRE